MGDPGAPLQLRGLPRLTRDRLDEPAHEVHHRDHLRRRQTAAGSDVERVVVPGHDVRTGQAAASRAVDQPEMSLVDRPRPARPAFEAGTPAQPVRRLQGHLPVDGVPHELHQLGLAGNVAVERHRRRAEPFRDLAHGQRSEPLGVRDLDRRRDDPAEAQSGPGRLVGAPQQLDRTFRIRLHVVLCHRYSLDACRSILFN
jgi:hypothetical protein